MNQSLLNMLIHRSRTQEIVMDDQQFEIVRGTSTTKQIEASGVTGISFSTSDTLPSGFTLSSSGVLSYDGTVDAYGYYPFTVTATKGELTATATITIALGTMVGEQVELTIAAGVDTTLYLYNNNGVLTSGPNNDWGGTGYHSDIMYTWVSFYPKHGLKYSLDGGTNWLDWCFEDTNSTLDLTSSGYGSWTSCTKISGRDTVSLSGQTLTINDPSGGSSIYEVLLVSGNSEFIVPEESSSSGSDSSSSGSSSTVTIDFQDQTFTFENCQSWSDQLQATCEEALEFTTDGNEPSGVTVYFDGLISCDGTTSADTYTFDVTATCQGNPTGVTATITLVVSDPVITWDDNPYTIDFYTSGGYQEVSPPSFSGYTGQVDWYMDDFPSGVSIDTSNGGTIQFDPSGIEADETMTTTLYVVNNPDVSDYGYPQVYSEYCELTINIYYDGEA